MKLVVQKSKELFERARKLIPGGVNSEIRGPAWGIMPGTYPMFVDKANGSKINDVDGNQFIDYVLAYGPIILGHSHPKVNKAVREQLEKGILSGLSHEIEYKVAEKIVKGVPCADMVRFLTTGSDAVTAAVRVARGHTGKEKIAIMDWMYHGTHDWSQVGVYGGPKINYGRKLSSGGVPRSVLEDVIILPWNDIEVLEKIVKREEKGLAAITLEPTTGEIPVEEEFLKALREITEHYGIILIFDEVKTGFRLAFGGAQQYYKVTPDLSTFAKAMANGYPISAIAGKRYLMEIIEKLDIRLGGTYNANGVGMAASLATLTELETRNGQAYRHLYKIGRKLRKGIRDQIEDVGIEAIVQGPETGPFRILFTSLDRITNTVDLQTTDEYPHKKRRLVFAEGLLKRGVWSHPNHVWYLSTAHTEMDIENTIEATGEALKEAKNIV
jgi:glutamate-1-semialdehyde 2,1-aminomutase